MSISGGQRVAAECGATCARTRITTLPLPPQIPGLMRVNPDQVRGPFAPTKRAYFALPPEVPPPPSLDALPTWPIISTPRADVAPVVNPYASLGA